MEGVIFILVTSCCVGILTKTILDFLLDKK